MVDINWPTNNNPGLNPQEGTGRLINTFAEQRGDGTPVWRRVPGVIVFARVPSSGSARLDFDANAAGAVYFSTYFELVGSTTLQTDYTTTSFSISYPSGTQSGDLVFLGWGSDLGAFLTTPTGWTKFATTVSFMGSQLMYKISTGETTVAASAAGSTSAAAVVALCWAIRGADQTSPICDTGTISTGASGDPVPAAFTCTTANSLLMTVAWIDDDAVTKTTGTLAPTTLTIAAATTFGCGGELIATSSGISGGDGATVAVAFRPMASTVAITAFSTWTLPSDDEWVTLNISIRHD